MASVDGCCIKNGFLVACAGWGADMSRPARSLAALLCGMAPDMASVAAINGLDEVGCELGMTVEAEVRAPRLAGPEAHGPSHVFFCTQGAGAAIGGRRPTMSEPGVSDRPLTQVQQGAPSLPEDVIDIEVFEQLLEMDEDDREFSRSLVWNYFEQAENTFDKMDAALYVVSTDAVRGRRSLSFRHWATFSRDRRQPSVSSRCGTAARRSSTTATATRQMAPRPCRTTSRSIASVVRLPL